MFNEYEKVDNIKHNDRILFAEKINITIETYKVIGDIDPKSEKIICWVDQPTLNFAMYYYTNYIKYILQQLDN